MLRLVGWCCVLTIGGSRVVAEPVASSPSALTGTADAPNGSWCWFEGERAIVDAADPRRPLLLAGAVSCGEEGGSEHGDIDVLWMNLETGERGVFELHDRFEADDHNSPALLRRSDGRYLAVYAGHNLDSVTRWRVSEPGDPTRWGPQQSIDNGARTTYSNLYRARLRSEESPRLYNFHRSRNFNPNLHVSDDEGDTWRLAGRLLAVGEGRTRPYVNYASDGKTIHLIATDGHPRDVGNAIYHGFVRDGQLCRSSGIAIDEDLEDLEAPSPSQLTQIAGPGDGPRGVRIGRCWGVDLELDDGGSPVALFTARVNDSTEDHRLYYARSHGGTWLVSPVAKMGSGLYARERDYTGLAAIDPQDPSTVFVSTPIDPATGAELSRHELFRGVTPDGGATWRWLAITRDSPVDNLRPVVPSWEGPDAVVLWLRGEYRTYQSWDTQVMCLRVPRDGGGG